MGVIGVIASFPRKSPALPRGNGLELREGRLVTRHPRLGVIMNRGWAYVGAGHRRFWYLPSPSTSSEAANGDAVKRLENTILLLRTNSLQPHWYGTITRHTQSAIAVSSTLRRCIRCKRNTPVAGLRESWQHFSTTRLP